MWQDQVKLLEEQQQDDIVVETTDRIRQDRQRLLQQKPWTDKIDKHSQETTGIKILEEILVLLGITKDYALNRNRATELALEEMLIAPTLVVHNETTQAVMPKSMVLDLGWFDGD